MPAMILIKDARVSYPHLFKQPIINGETGKCGATILLDPDNPALEELKRQITDLMNSAFKGRKLPPERVCLRRREDREEYGDMIAMSANCKEGKTPLVVAADGKTFVTDETKNAIYAGCRVHAKVRLWAQDNQYGKRINAELIAIQFAGDDEPLDDSYVAPEAAIEGFGPAGNGAASGADFVSAENRDVDDFSF